MWLRSFRPASSSPGFVFHPPGMVQNMPGSAANDVSPGPGRLRLYGAQTAGQLLPLASPGSPEWELQACLSSAGALRLCSVAPDPVPVASPSPGTLALAGWRFLHYPVKGSPARFQRIDPLVQFLSLQPLPLPWANPGWGAKVRTVAPFKLSCYNNVPFQCCWLPDRAGEAGQ